MQLLFNPSITSILNKILRELFGHGAWLAVADGSAIPIHPNLDHARQKSQYEQEAGQPGPVAA